MSRSLTLAVALAITPATFAATESGMVTETHRFGIYLGGVMLGTVTVDAEVEDTRYKASVSITPTGLLETIVKVQHRSRVAGAIGQGDLRPWHYRSRTLTRKRKSEVDMIYVDGRPSIRLILPEREPRDHDVVPADQIGTLDPTSAAFKMFRSVSRDDLCNTAQEIFDGRRRTRLVVEAPEFNDGEDEVHCPAIFKRVAGYSPEQLAKRSDFRATLTFKRQGDGLYQMQKIAAESTFGDVKILRR
ncbi:MAG: DUF3108 domain-containing protein [Paracoccaceae bacterium]|nr:DUF3108 domain-containing protein [Paracoccaceae bacterium]